MRKSPQRKQNIRLTLIASLLVVLTVPLVTLGILDIQTFDDRSRAAQELQNSLKCTIRFLYVDPRSLDSQKSVSVEIMANTPEESIQSIDILATNSDSSTDSVFKKEYSDNEEQVVETFVYKPKQLGQYYLSGTLTTKKASGSTGNYLCLLDTGGTGAAKGEVISSNSAPEFTTSIPTSVTNTLKVGDTYSYTIKAKDTDSINGFGYAYSFTPNATWLKASIDKKTVGNGTELSVKLSGITDYPASYLVNLIVWDGYNDHTRAQTWIINVDPKNNDIPRVTVSKPVAGTKIKQGDKMEIEWSVTDQNHIQQFKVFVASNPGNQATWIPINTDLDYDYNKRILDTSNLRPGNYTAIVQATDDQSPSATGTGLSSVFTVGSITEIPKGSDDGPQNREAQIINISPDENSNLKNVRPLIKASVIAGEDAKVKTDSIKMIFDGTDISDKLQVIKISESEYALTYSPSADLPAGQHKVEVSFEDDKGTKINRSWTFTIEQTEIEDEYITIFGQKIAKRTVIIGGLVILGVLLLAILVPWLVYALVRKKGDDYNSYPIYEKDTESNKRYFDGKEDDFSPPDRSSEKWVYQPSTTIEQKEIITKDSEKSDAENDTDDIPTDKVYIYGDEPQIVSRDEYKQIKTQTVTEDTTTPKTILASIEPEVKTNTQEETVKIVEEPTSVVEKTAHSTTFVPAESPIADTVTQKTIQTTIYDSTPSTTIESAPSPIDKNNVFNPENSLKEEITTFSDNFDNSKTETVINKSKVDSITPSPIDPMSYYAGVIQQEPAVNNENVKSVENVAVVPVVEPIVQPSVEPVTQPVIEPMVASSVEPVVTPTVQSVSESVPEPVVEPTVTSSVEPEIAPSVEPVVETIVEPTVTSSFQPVTQPIIDDKQHTTDQSTSTYSYPIQASDETNANIATTTINPTQDQEPSAPDNTSIINPNQLQNPPAQDDNSSNANTSLNETTTESDDNQDENDEEEIFEPVQEEMQNLLKELQEEMGVDEGNANLNGNTGGNSTKTSDQSQKPMSIEEQLQNMSNSNNPIAQNSTTTIQSSTTNTSQNTTTLNTPWEEENSIATSKAVPMIGE